MIFLNNGGFENYQLIRTLLSLVSLHKIGQSISSDIRLFLAIINLIMILKKLLSISNLAEAQALCIYKPIEGMIIDEDNKLIFVVFQVVTLSLNSINNSQNLLIISFILSLCRNYVFQDIGSRVIFIIFRLRKTLI